ncbi:putative cytochrome P450 E-class, group IV [Cladorrhinum samala]|uniref:Cytochrome P450 E-class, group IV n=1 Tax=Cladorrhinum samala TaxID=585594 RepID=A0AAV9HUH6_9PEZI|nr:putative cytochrome P450 E-class, group IV [Cladorrhinum samala]
MASSFVESLPPLPSLPPSVQSFLSSLPPVPQPIQAFLLSIPPATNAVIESLPLPLSALVPLALATAYLASCIHSHRRLSAFPGPPTTSFSYFWLIRTLASGQMGRRLADATSTHGATCRIGPNDLITSDPAVIKRISAARSGYTRSYWYKFTRLDPYDDAMMSTLNEKRHDELRTMTAPGYSGRDPEGRSERVVDKVLGTVVRVIRERYAEGGDRGKMLDLARMSQYFTLDSISEIAFGLEWGLVEAEEDRFGTMQTVEEIARPSVVVSGIPWLRAFLGSDWLLKFVGPSEKDKKGIGRLLPMAREVVAARFGPDGAKREDEANDDMLGSFIRHGLTQRQCQTEALFQIIAGSDTTATSIRATLLYIMTTPRVYGALRREIDEGIRAGRISSPIKVSEAAELPYLQGVILEGLRLHPPFTGIPSKVVPPQGDTIDGKFVPGGTRISPSHWAIGRHKGVFGEDADLFRPERWVPTENAGSEEKEKLAEMRRVAEMAFGYGRWGCAGKVIAFMELNKVFVELLRRFDLQLVYPFDPWRSLNFNLFLQHSMWVNVTMRETD